MSKTDILTVVNREDAARYYKNLSAHADFNVQVAYSREDMIAILNERHTDVLVIDNRLESSYNAVSEVRQSYPRILIVLVDEEADFGMPGQADEMSTEPFHNDDLARRIKRLISDRQMETLRSDSLPAVRNVAKRLREAPGLLGKQEAGVQACRELGYDYVGYYHIVNAQPLVMSLKAQAGSNAIMAIAPKEATADDLMGWVVQNTQSRIAAPEDRPNYLLVARGRLGAVACVPVVFTGTVYGAVAACRDRPGSITQENVLMLELVASQMAAAIAKEIRG